MNSKTGKYGMGWIPDYPDIRDYTENTEEIREVLSFPKSSKAKSLLYRRISENGVHP